MPTGYVSAAFYCLHNFPWIWFDYTFTRVNLIVKGQRAIIQHICWFFGYFFPHLATDQMNCAIFREWCHTMLKIENISKYWSWKCVFLLGQFKHLLFRQKKIAVQFINRRQNESNETPWWMLYDRDLELCARINFNLPNRHLLSGYFHVFSYFGIFESLEFNANVISVQTMVMSNNVIIKHWARLLNPLKCHVHTLTFSLAIGNAFGSRSNSITNHILFMIIFCSITEWEPE